MTGAAQVYNTRSGTEPKARSGTVPNARSGATPYSALSSASISICSKLKRLCINFKGSSDNSGDTTSVASTEYKTVSSEQGYETPTRPCDLALRDLNCCGTPVFTPSTAVEPIVIDMNDFELMFDRPICEICKSG